MTPEGGGAGSGDGRGQADGRRDAPQDSQRPLGILAGAGPLPIEVAEAACRQGRGVHIVAIDGFAAEDVARYPHERVSLGQIGRMLRSYARAGVEEMVIAGALQRPNLWSLRIDAGFLANLPTVLALTRGGDDSVLRRVVRFFEGHGLRVVAVGDVAPDLLAPAGALSARLPDAGEQAALARARAVIARLGPFDVGQGVVATRDGIVAVEGVRGTDAMLRDLADDGPGAGLARGGVLVKLAKPGQEMRIDLPTIGSETVRRAAAAGLAGIAIGAGGAIVLGREAVGREADAAGLFVAGIEPVPQPDGASEFDGLGSTGLPGSRDGQVLEVISRRVPTPGERRDLGLARRLMTVLRANEAGRAAVVARDHVLAVSGALPVAPTVAALTRRAGWGLAAVGRRSGVLLIDGPDPGPASDEAGVLDGTPDAAIFDAAAKAGLAGVVYLGRIDGDRARGDVGLLANAAGMYLMVLGGPR